MVKRVLTSKIRTQMGPNICLYLFCLLHFPESCLGHLQICKTTPCCPFSVDTRGSSALFWQLLSQFLWGELVLPLCLQSSVLEQCLSDFQHKTKDTSVKQVHCSSFANSFNSSAATTFSHCFFCKHAGQDTYGYSKVG